MISPPKICISSGSSLFRTGCRVPPAGDQIQSRRWEDGKPIPISTYVALTG